MNPILPIIVRECDGTRAKVFARYDYNNMKELDLEDLTDQEVENCVKRLVEIGEVMPRCPSSIPRPEQNPNLEQKVKAGGKSRKVLSSDQIPKGK